MNAPIIPKFKSFEASILFMNGMYNLPIAPYPCTHYVEVDEFKRLPVTMNASVHSSKEMIVRRLDGFMRTVNDEITEGMDIQEAIKNGQRTIDTLVELADWLADLTVFIRSEAAKFGIPLEEVIQIVMDSNFSKLGEDGKPIMDANGKFLKGPNYWKPEEKIKELLLERIADSSALEGNEWTDYSKKTEEK